MKKIRCLTLGCNYDGSDVDGLKDYLEDLGLHVYLGKIMVPDSHGARCEIVFSDKQLTNNELSEIREFWPPEHDWSEPWEDSCNNDNDVK